MDEYSVFRDTAFWKRVIVTSASLLLMMIGLWFLGIVLFIASIFVWMQYDRPKPPPHGEKLPAPPCPTCGDPLTWYADAGRYYCRKCIKWFSG